MADFVVEEQIGFLIRRAQQRHASLFQSMMADAVGEAELTPTQFTALVRTVAHGQVTQNHLGRLAAMDPATIQGVVRRLIARGLVRRTTDPMDRRSAVLTATPDGVALASRAVTCARRVTEAVLAPLAAADQRRLKHLLGKIA